MQNVLAIGALYATPKILAYLHEKPLEEKTNSLFYQVRSYLSKNLEMATTQLGEKGCFLCNEVVGDNAWISAIVFALLLKNKPIFGKNPMDATAALICGSALVWLARFGLSYTHSSIAYFIAPKSFNTPKNAEDQTKAPIDINSKENSDPLLKTYQNLLYSSKSEQTSQNPAAQALVDHRLKYLRDNETTRLIPELQREIIA